MPEKLLEIQADVAEYAARKIIELVRKVERQPFGSK